MRRSVLFHSDETDARLVIRYNMCKHYVCLCVLVLITFFFIFQLYSLYCDVLDTPMAFKAREPIHSWKVPAGNWYEGKFLRAFHY